MNLFVFSANLCWSLWNPHSEAWRVHVFGQCYCSPRDFSSFHESWCPPYFARFREIPNSNHENLWQIRQSHHVRPGEGKREKRRPYISCAHRIRQKSEDVKWGNFLLGRSIITKIHPLLILYEVNFLSFYDLLKYYFKLMYSPLTQLSYYIN